MSYDIKYNDELLGFEVKTISEAIHEACRWWEEYCYFSGRKEADELLEIVSSENGETVHTVRVSYEPEKSDYDEHFLMSDFI
jgi:hypothetical protein